MNPHATDLQRGRRPFMQHAAAVLSACRKAPSQVASICPSSRVLVNRIADRDCIRTASKIVDLGPGTGGTTSAILDHASPHCRVLAIEKTPEFIEPLTSLGDPRLTVQQGDAEAMDRILLMHEMGEPDVIISGIPFSSLPRDAARSIVQAIHRDLRDGGEFIAYQLRGHVARYALEFFGEPDSTQWVFWNLPPLRIFTWRKS